MGEFWLRTYQNITKHRLWFSLAVIIVLTILGTTVSKIEFEEDISKLIPIHSENEDFEKVLKTVNFTDKIIVNIRRGPEGSVTDLTKYATQFIDSVGKQAKGYFNSIQGRIADDDVLKTMDFVYAHLPLFLDTTDYISIRHKISKDSLLAITRENYKTLLSPSGIVAKKTIVKDPLGLSFIALKKLQQLGMAGDFILKDGFILSRDERNILLFITPEFPSDETAKNEVFVDRLYTIQQDLNKTFDHKVQGEYFGAVLVAVANAQQIKKDIQFTVGIALTLLLLTLMFFYKNPAVPIILFLPTLFGALLAIALLYVIRHKISAISLGIGSVLLGVTLDYALHILTHIRNGNSIRMLYKDVAPSILLSSITTAAAFLCLLFLKSQALQDLGIFAAVSVLGASVFALLFIPQVYTKSVKNQIGRTLLDRLAAYDFDKNKWGIGLVVLLLIMSFFTYNKVIFNKDLSKLNYEPEHLIEARERLDALTDINSKSIYLAVYGTDQEDVLRKNDALYQELRHLKNKGSVLGFSSVGALVQSERTQEAKIKIWKEFWDNETQKTVKAHLIESGNELGFKPSTFDAFYDLLHTDFRPLGLTDYDAVNAFSLSDYVGRDSNLITITTLVKVDSAHIDKVHTAFENNKNTLVIDRQGMNEAFLGNLKNDFNRLIRYSVLAVLLLLFLYFRSFSLTLVTALPIFLTWLMTIGIMGIIQIEFNIFNIIISTFIFGLGVDYSIFMTNGLLSEYRTGEKIIPTYKTSIILSVITTVLGVGVLIFAKHPALYTISLVSLIGILSAVFIAFTLQPLLFKVFIGSTASRPIPLRVLLHSLLSTSYYALGCIVFSLISTVLIRIVPISKKIKMAWFHRISSQFLKSVLYSNPFVTKKIIALGKAQFNRPGIIIANHTSALDSLTIGMLHPKIIFLVNDWVYNSPVFRMAAQLAEFYPVSSGIEKSLAPLRKKVAQGYSLMAFPEGSRSSSNKIKRFHKGAFYLAERLDLDIIPILIHGNSEVQAKGSPVISDGSITVKVLDRIPLEDASFGIGDRQRARKISSYFKQAFLDFRARAEGVSYFHKQVLDDFRFKGTSLFKVVRTDLNSYKDTYHTILRTVGNKDSILHLTRDNGQLDFLLALDQIDRKIITVMPNENSRAIFGNSYITQNRSRITVLDAIDTALDQEINTLIVGTDICNIDVLLPKIQNEISTLILLKTGRNLTIENMAEFGFLTEFENEACIIAKKKEQREGAL